MLSLHLIPRGLNKSLITMALDRWILTLFGFCHNAQLISCLCSDPGLRGRTFTDIDGYATTDTQGKSWITFQPMTDPSSDHYGFSGCRTTSKLWSPACCGHSSSPALQVWPNDIWWTLASPVPVIHSVTNLLRRHGLTSRILTCTELKGHCFVLVSGYVC